MSKYSHFLQILNTPESSSDLPIQEGLISIWTSIFLSSRKLSYTHTRLGTQIIRAPLQRQFQFLCDLISLKKYFYCEVVGNMWIVFHLYILRFSLGWMVKRVCMFGAQREKIPVLYFIRFPPILFTVELTLPDRSNLPINQPSPSPLHSANKPVTQTIKWKQRRRSIDVWPK